MQIIQWTNQMTLFSRLFDILDAHPINGFIFVSFYNFKKKNSKKLNLFD